MNTLSNSLTIRDLFRRGILSSLMLTILVGEVIVFGWYIYSQLRVRMNQEKMVETIIMNQATDLLTSYALKNREAILLQLRYALRNSPIQCAYLTTTEERILVVGESHACDLMQTRQPRWSSVPVESGDLHLGTLDFIFDNLMFSSLGDFRTLFFGFLVVIPLLMLTWVLLARNVKTSIVEPLKNLTDSLEKKRFNPTRSFGCYELEVLSNAIDGYRQSEEFRARGEAVEDLARQVAHDIRSPLTALQMAVSSVDQIPEDARVLIRAAVTQISDIANHLVDGEPRNRIAVSRKRVESNPELVSGILERVVSEKRIQFGERRDVVIESILPPETYPIFCNVNPPELKRILSNIINNSLEAIEGSGKITVMLTATDQLTSILIKDTGRGIPDEWLLRIGEKGVSFGKSDGMGLGLYHAKTTIESWNGKLLVSSRHGEGTEVKILLPRSSPPSWFLPELKLTPGTTVAVLDDDPSIHGLWKFRFESYLQSPPRIKLLHFSSGRQLAQYLSEHPEQKQALRYLVDYELIGEPMNGVQIIQSLELNHRAILVTSHFENRSVLLECERVGLKVVPKNLAAALPIVVSN